MDQTGSDATLRSGVVVALPVEVDRTVVRNLCFAHERRCDRIADGNGEVIAVFGFDSDVGETVLAVSAIGRGATERRPDVRILLGSPVLDAIRIDTFVTRIAPLAAERAEALLVRLACEIADNYGGLVCDDVGAVYDSDEIEELVAEGHARQTSFAFDFAAAQSELDVISQSNTFAPIVFLPSDGRVEPADCAADVGTERASVFVIMGPYVPLVTAARIVVLATRDGHSSVICFAPNLARAEGAVLAAAGIRVARSTAELDAALAIAEADAKQAGYLPASGIEHDEIVCYARSDDDIETLRRQIARRSLDIATVASQGAAQSMPTFVELLHAEPGADLPTRVARFAFAGTLVDMYFLDLATAHPLLASLVGSRGVVAAICQGEPHTAIICESLVADSAIDRDDLAAADAFALSLIAQAAERTNAFAMDAAGAAFGPRELQRLSGARRGRRGSWAERTAVSRLATGAE